MKKHLLTLAVCGMTAAAAQAQFDNGVWPGFRGRADKNASVQAPGPAVNHAFTRTDLGIGSTAGFTVAENGDVYFKTHDDGGSIVYRLNPVDGSTLAQSIDFGGGIGNYGGVAIGTDAVYITMHAGSSTPAIIKLDKVTLGVINTWELPEFGSLRGTPLISDVTNVAGNHVLYVADRTNIAIHAVDAITGDVMWTHFTLADTPFGQVGPMWTLGDGRQAIAYFGNVDLGPGVALADNGNGTYEVLWEFAGPGSFNWFGTGAMSADEQRIYVTTFNDNDVPPLWAISVADGSVVWDIPGFRGEPNERNYYARPAVIGNRIYCGGGFGVVTCVEDTGATGNVIWEYRDGIDEHTSISAVETNDGTRYIYAVKQGAIADPNGFGASLIVLRDDGANYTLILDTDLGNTMRNTLFGNNSATVDALGQIWIGGGNSFDDGVNPGDIYVLSPEADCYADFNGDGTVNTLDFLAYLNAFSSGDPDADCNGDGDINTLDFLCFLNAFNDGCP